MKCLKLRDLFVCIDGNESGTSVVSSFATLAKHSHELIQMQQLLLDTVAHLPELRILRCWILDPHARRKRLKNFKPIPGLRYVKEFGTGGRRYLLEKDGEQTVRYRETE
jgi:hypothetical protein